MIVSHFINFFILDKNTKDFISKNISFFKIKNQQQKSIILVEFNGWQPLHVANSIFLNVLKNFSSSEIVAYENFKNLINYKENLFDNLKWFIGSLFYLKTFMIYKSFGISRFIRPIISSDLKIKSILKSRYLQKKIKTKNDIENITIDNIWVGDLLYDSFLKKYNVITIDPFSKNFRKFLIQFVELYYYWKYFFKNNNVKAIVCSHAVYSLGLPLRIAVFNNIKSYTVSENKIYYFKKKDILVSKGATGIFSESKYFKKIFDKFNFYEKNLALKKGKNLSTDISVNKKNFFYVKKNKTVNFKKILIERTKKSKIKVLISPHSFLDSPHVYGKNLFCDFYDWFNFIEKIIPQTNYQWFIKSHPNMDATSNKAIQNFLKLNPSVNELPSGYNINHLKRIGINFVLTIFGSVAREYSTRNILVINASINNPHKNFKFSLTPKSIKEYRNTLLNLGNQKYKINKKDLYIYHYMDNIYFNRNYLFKDFDNFVLSQNGWKNLYKNVFYKIYLDYMNPKRREIVLKIISNFIKSKDYTLCLKHQNIYYEKYN
jgi:hypothetical protein